MMVEMTTDEADRESLLQERHKDRERQRRIARAGPDKRFVNI